MKKMVFTAVALAMGMMAMATEKAYVEIQLTGASGQSSSITLTEDDERNSTFESGFDTEKMMVLSNSKSVLIYAKQGEVICEDILTNDLKNLKIGFTTNKVDKNYTLKFIDKSGASIKLYDKSTNPATVIDLDAVTKYDFSVADEQVGQKQIWDRFVVNYEAVGFDVCFIGNHLTVSGNPWEAGKIVVFDGETKVVEKEGDVADIDLTALTIDKHYTVKFFPTDDITGEAAKTLVIVPVTLP